jgi:hypothetical protein
MTCYTCKTNNALYICGECQSIGYCSKKCQKKDWKTQHSNICSKQFIIGKQISMVEAESRGSKTNTIDFSFERLLTLRQMEQYDILKYSLLVPLHFYPTINLTIYKEKSIGNLPTFTETYYNIYKIISNLSLSVYKIIEKIFNLFIRLEFVDFETLDRIAGPFFNMVNSLLGETVVRKNITNTSTEEAFKIANSLKNPLPFDYALGEIFFDFDINKSSRNKMVHVLFQPKLYYFMEKLYSKYFNVAYWFTKIILFKIFKEIGINKSDMTII